MSIRGAFREMLKTLALRIPPLRRIWDERQALRARVASLEDCMRKLPASNQRLEKEAVPPSSTESAGPTLVGDEIQPSDYQPILHPPFEGTSGLRLFKSELIERERCSDGKKVAD